MIRYLNNKAVRIMGGVDMVDEKITIQDASEVDPNLLRMLDRGLEDIEAGRTLPHKKSDGAGIPIRCRRSAPRADKSLRSGPQYKNRADRGGNCSGIICGRCLRRSGTALFPDAQDNFVKTIIKS